MHSRWHDTFEINLRLLYFAHKDIRTFTTGELLYKFLLKNSGYVKVSKGTCDSFLVNKYIIRNSINYFFILLTF